MRKFSALVILLLLAFSVSIPAFGGDKVTICHAAGRDGTTHYETLTIAYNAAFGQAGHFFENGTPRAGHEQDYLGECNEVSEDTTTTSTTTVPSTTSTSNAESTTTTVVVSTTTSQVVDTTTSTIHDTTSTSIPNNTTTTLVDTPTTVEVPETTVTTVCTEDMECWDCEVMGNYRCGTAPVQLPFTGASVLGLSVSALSAIGLGSLLVKGFRKND